MTLWTLATPASHQLEVKHSRFLAQAAIIDSADAAQATLAPLSDPAATHNCWAWRVGAQYRSSDDGEPAGTAGRPILAAIDGQGCDQVLVVVTRWFGGIKLGAGGLVRAYGGAAAECLRRAEKRPLILFAELEFACPFANLGDAHAALNAAEASKIDERFDADGVNLRVRLPAERVDDLKTRLRDATRDRVRFAAQG
ncbi:MAG: YigZ family protein [Xanthomonadales bacterium]|nr:YigZ family protein [Xanthomonadales bacterium]